MEETALHRPLGSVGAPDTRAGTDVESLVGRRVGQYRIDRVLGRGTMAWVFKAKHLGLGRPCALKIMDPGLVERQPGIREQFWAEARAAANVLHPHVVTIHNIGRVHGLHFIEMEYVRGGQTLRESLVRDGPFDPVRASTLARQVVMALGAAHDAGLVHRDIKPANVLLTPDGGAKRRTSGLVRRLDDLSDGGALGRHTQLRLAPELFRGTPASPRSDIYALGVLLFHTLSGRLPFVAENVGQLIHLHQNQPIPGHSPGCRGDSGRTGRDRREVPRQVPRRSIRDRTGTGRLARAYHPPPARYGDVGSRSCQRAELLHPGIWRHVSGHPSPAR